MLAQMFFQRLHFLHVCIRQDGPPVGLIKDETCLLVKGCCAKRVQITEELTRSSALPIVAPPHKTQKWKHSLYAYTQSDYGRPGSIALCPASGRASWAAQRCEAATTVFSV